MPKTLSTAFMALSGLGFLVLWGNMALNGGSDGMLRTAFDGVFPDGTPLDPPDRTGIWLLDFPMNCLMSFFATATKVPATKSFAMTIEMTAALVVINLMVVVESRRRVGFCMRAPATWHCLWNLGGVAMVLPIWALLYTRQRAKTGTARVPVAEAVVLPLTAVFSMALQLPLLVPGFLGANPASGQRGAVYFLLSPPVYSAFQTAAAWLAGAAGLNSDRDNDDGGETSRTSVRAAYCVLAGVSGLLHLACIVAALSPLDGFSLAGLYVPDGAAVYAAAPAARLYQAIVLFLQWDFVLTNVVVLLLGGHLLLGGERKKNRRGGAASVAVMLAATAALGPGAGLAYALCCEEQRAVKED